MKLIATLPVRNEEWIVGLSLRVALLWCDGVIVLNHCSTDRSLEIIEEVSRMYPPGRVKLLTDCDPTWQEMPQRQRMLEAARNHGATHMAIIDADEILDATTLPRIRSLVESTPPGHILTLPLYNLRGGISKYHANGVWGQRWVSLAFADDKRLHWGGDTFHKREPQGMTLSSYRPLQQVQGGVMHLWASSEKRLIEKHKLYKCVERARWPNKSVQEIDQLYSMATEGRPQYGDHPARWTYADVPAAWWAGYQDLMQYLDVDVEPWQTGEVTRLVRQYGSEYFKGLRI